jgi:hypothetical protein
MSLSRSASFVVFLLGLASIFSWAWWQINLFEQSTSEPRCGMLVWAVYGEAALGSALTSLLATLLNALSFVRLSKPRPVLRMIELAVLTIPAILAGLLIGTFLYKF